MGDQERLPSRRRLVAGAGASAGIGVSRILGGVLESVFPSRLAEAKRTHVLDDTNMTRVVNLVQMALNNVEGPHRVIVAQLSGYHDEFRNSILRAILSVLKADENLFYAKSPLRVLGDKDIQRRIALSELAMDILESQIVHDNSPGFDDLEKARVQALIFGICEAAAKEIDELKR